MTSTLPNSTIEPMSTEREPTDEFTTLKADVREIDAWLWAEETKVPSSKRWRAYNRRMRAICTYYDVDFARALKEL